MAIAEISPSAIKIDKLISRVSESDIKIPAFQRHFVWDQEQVIELLDSIYGDYPIGSILLWNSLEKLKATRNICVFVIPERDDAYPVNYVLDGQQRLSTIYAVFSQDRAQGNDPEANANLQTFKIFFDLDSREFRATTDLVSEHRSFPLKVLFELRHADPRITLGLYGHVIGDAYREAVVKVASILASNGLNQKPQTEVIQ